MDAEYEILPDDYVHPPHDPDYCGQCTYVANVESIIVPKDIRDQAIKVFGPNSIVKAILADLGLGKDPIVRLGKYTMKDWKGCLPFYAFWCIECEQVRVSYPHGYRLYLTCHECRLSIYLTEKKYFEEANLQPPLSFWQELKLVREMTKKIKKQPTSG